jgi:hypothetical protein
MLERHDENMEKQFTMVLKSLTSAKVRRSMAQLLDQPVNTEANKIGLPAKQYRDLVTLVQALLDQCLEHRDWSNAVSSLTCGKLIFCKQGSIHARAQTLPDASATPSTPARNSNVGGDNVADSVADEGLTPPSLEHARSDGSLNGSQQALLATLHKDLDSEIRKHSIFTQTGFWDRYFQVHLDKATQDAEVEASTAAGDDPTEESRKRDILTSKVGLLLPGLIFTMLSSEYGRGVEYVKALCRKKMKGIGFDEDAVAGFSIDALADNLQDAVNIA